MRARFVGVPARELTHAVWVPHDLPLVEHKPLNRDGRAPLVSYGGWYGQAECGQVVRGIVAGPNGGHDWDYIAEHSKCPKCARKVIKQVGNQLDDVMRVLWESRTQRMKPWTDDEWAKVKENPVHRASLRMLREEAIRMIEDGEFD